MEGELIESSTNSDAYVSAYVQELKAEVETLAQQILILESRLTGVDANLSTNLDGLQSVVEAHSSSMTNEALVRAKLVQGVQDQVSELRSQNTADHVFLMEQIERHHAEQESEVASIRASLSEERSERAQGDATVLATLQDQADQAQWYYNDTKDHLAKHDQMLDDVTWDSSKFTLDNDQYRFGWTMLSAAQEWETEIGSYITKVQKMVDDKLRTVEVSLQQAVSSASKALENTEVSTLVERLQGQVGLSTLDAILSGKINELEIETERERQERIRQIRLEADSLALRLQQETTALQEQLLAEAIKTADALAAEAARAAERAEFEAQQRTEDILAEAQARAAAILAEAEQRNAAIAQEASERALAIQAEADARASAITGESQARIDAINKEIADRTAAILQESNARKAEIQAERDARIAAINEKAAALTADYTKRIGDLGTELRTSIQTLSDGVTASVAELQTADANIISSLNAYKVSNNAALAAVSSRVDVVAQEQNATATVVDGLVVAVDQNTADITTLNQTIVSKEQALSEQITGLATALDTAETALGAQITQANTAISALDSSTATRFDEVNAQLTLKSQQAMDAAASAQQTADSAVSTNAAQATEISNLKTRMTTTEGNVAKKADATTVSALSNEVTGIGTTVSAHSNQLTQLASSIELANNEIGTVRTSAANAQTTADSAVTANTALASRVDALSAMITDLEAGAETNVDVYAFNALKLNVDSIDGRVTTNTQNITSLQTGLNNAQAGVDANASAVSQLQTKQTSQGNTITQLVSDTTVLKNDMTTVKADLQTKADATAMSDLELRVENVEGVNVSQGTALTNLQNSLASTNNTVAQKADTTALNTLQTKVTEVEGKVTTNTNSITSLTGRVTTVEGTLQTKADASALNNYYTKTQSDASATTIAAGEINKFNAALSIGTENLITQALWKTPAFSGVNQADRYEFKLVKSVAPYTAWAQFGPWTNIQEGTKMVLSFKIKALDATPLTIGGHTSGIAPNGTGVLVYLDGVLVPNTNFHTGTTTIPNDEKYHLVVVLMTKSGTGSDYVYIQPNRPTSYNQPVNCSIKEVMLSVGTAYVEWDAPKEFIQNQLNANSIAINNTNTEVTRINGVVVAQGSSISKLQSDLTTTDTTAKTALQNAATAQSTANTGVTKADAAASSVSTLRTEYEAKVLELEDADSANAAAITQTNTDLLTAQTALSNADTALGNRIDSLTTTVSDNLNTVRGEIQDVADSVTTLEGSTNTKFTNLESSLNNLNTTVGTKADATALNALTTRVTNVEGVNTSQATSINTINSNITKLDELTRVMNSGKLVHTDPTFKLGSNNVAVYNNTGNGNVTITRRTRSADNPTTSTHELLVKTVGTASPSWGGIYQNIQTRANAVFLVKYIAKLPSGYWFTPAANAMGNGASDKLYGQTSGTGKFETFYRITRCGPDGSFSTAGHLYVGGSPAPTVDTPLEWVLASIELYDCTDFQEVPTTVLNSIANAQNTADTAVSQGQANATAISNLTTTVNANNAAVNGRIDTVANSVTTLEGNTNSQINSLQSALTAVDTKADTGIANAATAQNTADTAVSKANANASNITALDSRLSTAETEIDTKASVAALDSLTTRVSNAEGTLTSQGSSITSLNNSLATTNSNVTKALNAVDVKDTRNTNELPNWYWTNHPKRIVNEFKTASVIGVSGLGTYVNLETRVYYPDASGGPIIQVAYSPNDPLLQMVRRSSGSGSGAIWTAWAQPLKALSDTVNTKADASALNALDSEVTAIDGRVSANTSSITSLQGSVTTINNTLTTKADASALNTTNTKVTEIDGKVATQATQITNLSASLASVSDSVASYDQAIQTLTDHDTTQATLIEKMTAELIPHMAGNQDLPAGAMDVYVGYEGTITALADANAATQWAVDRFTTQFQDQYAGTQSQIEQLNYLISDNQQAVANRIDTLEASFESVVNDTLTPAVNSLTARIEQDFITKTDANAAIAAATTTLKSEVTQEYSTALTDAINGVKLDAVEIPDTRNDDQPPSWYWSNYPRSRVSEFKTAAVVGLSAAMVGSTFGTLTTVVPWNDSTGGPIRQIMEGTSEDKVYMRYSLSGTGWSDWVKQGNSLQVSITEQSQTINGIKGIKTVTIDNNGVLSGYGLVSELVNGQVTSAFGVNADQFYVGSPTTGKKVFSVVDGTTVINDAVIGNLSASKITTGTLHGDRITAGTITADKLSVGSLEALNVRIGTLRTASTGARLEITDTVIRVYDDNNILRVRLGIW